MPVIGLQKLVDDLQKFERLVDRDAEQVPREISNSIKRHIVLTDSIDTGLMISSIDYNENIVVDGHRFLVGAQDNDVFYDGFVDQPGETRNWPGRFFYKRGIEGANIERVFDKIANEAFVV